MALGELTYGLTVREMAQAYCPFVNDGIFTYSRTYSLVTDKDGNVVIDNAPSTIQAFKPNTAYTMTYMMQNGVENGTGGEAALWTMPVAGKTGSSSNYQDRWFVGCTPYYVAAVWTGYDMPERIHVSGNPAAQLWKKVMTPVHDGLPWEAFTYPYLGENTGIFGYDDSTLTVMTTSTIPTARITTAMAAAEQAPAATTISPAGTRMGILMGILTGIRTGIQTPAQLTIRIPTIFSAAGAAE